MKVLINIEIESVIREVERDTEIGTEIFFEHEGIFYPNNTWDDFGLRILGFWLYQLVDMRKKNGAN